MVIQKLLIVNSIKNHVRIYVPFVFYEITKMDLKLFKFPQIGFQIINYYKTK